MKRILLTALGCLICSPVLAQEVPQPTPAQQVGQLTALANAVAGQRNDALNAAATCQAGTAQLQQQLADDAAKIADLEKQLAAAKPSKP